MAQMLQDTRQISLVSTEEQIVIVWDREDTSAPIRKVCEISFYQATLIPELPSLAYFSVYLASFQDFKLRNADNIKQSMMTASEVGAASIS